MSNSSTASPACAPQTLTAADGAELTACAHGGHVLGWTPAGGRPRLWLSPTARCGPGLAIRGGIPVIFPQFSDRGPLPKHGLARDRAWQVTIASAGDASDAAATWQATLTDDEATRAIWPHRFELTLTARAAGDRLDVTLSVSNTGDVEWEFAAALHSYLALGDPATQIYGLTGRNAQDNAADRQPIVLGAAGADLRSGLPATQQRDAAVPAAGQPVPIGDPVLIDDPVLGALGLTAEGLPDRVVWNPGPGHGLADVPDGEESGFVCVEPAALESIVVMPAGRWEGRLTLHARPAKTRR